MMNDRFAVQLRQHLLDTANERPAEGHLAAIVERVAVTPQRRWLRPRLPEIPAWAGGLPVAVRYGLLAIALVLAALAGAILAGGGTQTRSTPFEGSWTTIDVPDGSRMNLYVGAGRNPTVRFEDLHATGEGCRNDPGKVFTADGAGHINRETLEATYPNGGGCGLERVSIAGRYVYNADADILVDQDGLIWARVPRGDGPLPTLPPEPTPALIFEGTWTAIDPSDGSGLTLVVGDGAIPVVQFQDDLASGDGCREDAIKVFRADGVGVINGNRLAASYPDGGGCGFELVPIAGQYRYDGATDSLLDQDGVTWTRLPPGSRPTLRPAPTRQPAVSLAGGCIDLTQGGTYTATAETISVSATVPVTPAYPWRGARDEFHLTGSCDQPAPMGMWASTATEVYQTSCMPDGEDFGTFAEAIARLDTPKGPDISPRVDLTIDGHPAARYDITNLTTCPDGFGLWHMTALGGGETGSIYVIDVDGVLVEIELNRDGSQTRAELEEADAIVASLTFP
jgi:hypothetical protein